MGELLVGLSAYFAFYNAERLPQSLDNPTPQEVHKTSSGGGAMIVDKYRVKEKRPTALCSVGRHCKQRGLRVTLKLQVQLQKPGQRRPAARSRVQLELPSSLF